MVLLGDQSWPSEKENSQEAHIKIKIKLHSDALI